jgi:hypothetical protein
VSAPEVHEFELWLSTHDDLHHGVTVAEVVKLLVAEATLWKAYRTAVAVAWRGDRQVTKVWWVP